MYRQMNNSNTRIVISFPSLTGEGRQGEVKRNENEQVELFTWFYNFENVFFNGAAMAKVLSNLFLTSPLPLPCQGGE